MMKNFRLSTAAFLICTVACDRSKDPADDDSEIGFPGSSSSTTSSPTASDARTEEGAFSETESSETESSETESSETESSETESSETEERCYDRSASWTWSSPGMLETALVCDLPQLCDNAQVYPESDLPFCLGPVADGFEVPPYDPAPGTCILDALVAGTPALHNVTRCANGQFRYSISIGVLGDGTLIWRSAANEDLNTSVRETWRTMMTTEELEACDVSTPEGLWSCMEALATTECQIGQPMCSEG